MDQLRLRLENCLQTILDLEPGIRKNRLAVFESDFLYLKSFLERIDRIKLLEEDVSRLENVTSCFLKEIGRKSSWISNCKMWQ